MINLNDNDLDLDNIDLTNDYPDIGHDYNQMTDIELDCGGTNVSQHEYALRKLKRMRASCISDWISNDKDKTMVNMEMKPLAMDTCSIDTKDGNVDEVLTETPIMRRHI